MPKQTAKVDLANLLIRKQGLIRTIRDQLLHRDEIANERDYAFVRELEEVLNAIDLADRNSTAR